MPAPDDWIEVRRSTDRERVGWLRAEGDEWMPIDILGRDLPDGPRDWDRAERALDDLGLSFLAERWELDTPDGPIPVRIVEVSDERIVVIRDDFGAASAIIPGMARDERVLPWPAPEGLRLR